MPFYALEAHDRLLQIKFEVGLAMTSDKMEKLESVHLSKANRSLRNSQRIFFS